MRFSHGMKRKYETGLVLMLDFALCEYQTIEGSLEKSLQFPEMWRKGVRLSKLHVFVIKEHLLKMMSFVYAASGNKLAVHIVHEEHVYIVNTASESM